MKSKFAPLSLLSRLAKDARGTVLVQFIIYIVAIMGMMGLALDGGRFFLLNNSLQELADAAALAGAAQLDGAKDAITRADDAAQATATNNPPKWWDAGGSATITTTYYSSLNKDPTKDKTTTNAQDANYIRVTTASSQTAPSFLNAVSVVTKTAIANNSTTATAVAQGNDFANCGVTQTFICNPYENSEANPGAANNFASNVPLGTMFALLNKFVGGAPGNWGLLDAPAGSNPHDQPPFWAQSTVGQSCTTGDSQGTTRPGNVAKFAQDGENVRFDSPIGSGDESLSAPITIDGFQSHGSGFNCNRIDPAQGGKGIDKRPSGFAQTDTNPTAYDNACNNNPGSCPLPRDRTFTNAVGNGPNLTDLQAYWKNHHGGSLPAGISTRYQIYQNEVAGTNGANTWTTDSIEPHGPTCTKSTLGDASRRVINVAIVDCNYWGITGKKALPATTLIAQFFMTEPALSDGSIYGEFIGIIQAGTASANGIIHRIVQLVR